MKHMLRNAFTIAFLLCIKNLMAQPVQAIRGSVTDQASNQPLAFSTATILNINPAIHAVADSAGNFTLAHVPIGRYDVRVACVGYESQVINEVLVGSAKQTYLTIRLLSENATKLNEVVVKAKVNKELPLNNTATLSARMLSVEEAQRYAGGFDDPARLVAAFAGVSGNIGNNAIIVRGNSPQSLQWKMEGVEIPSPNHLGDMRAFGGGSVTALSTQLLGNSDFFTGAMPAEYSNALSGVFDVFLRNGNNKKREHTLQVGVVGVDAASEGPFKKGGKSSYLFNYRYSTLALVAPLLAENAGGIKYQDLSFKLNFPTLKAGTFSVWAIGLADRVGANAKQHVNEWVYDDDRENHNMNLYMGAAGIGHTIRINGKQYLKLTLAATTNNINYPTERLDSNLNITPKSLLNNKYYNVILSSSLNTRLNTKHTNKTGFTITGMHYNLHLRNTFSATTPMVDVTKETGSSMLVAAYTNSTISLGGRSTLNAGINAQLFTLNHRYSIEPRVGVKYRLAERQSLAFAYGLHSRLERLNYYFIRNSAGDEINIDLSFTKAHHLVLGYDLGTSQFTHLKIEAYYQHLFDVPVIADSSFSMLNQAGDWFFNAPLQSSGLGSNYGADITFEKYLSKGYYYIATVSIFNALYKGGDDVWRSSRYDRSYALNMLIGKEWFLGKGKQNVLGLNTRFSYLGGDRYSPVNSAMSIAGQSVVFDEHNAFSLQYPSAFTSHLTISYKINRQKVAHQIALKILNLTGYEEYVGFRYNYTTNQVDIKREPVVIPNLSYRIDF